MNQLMEINFGRMSLAVALVGCAAVFSLAAGAQQKTASVVAPGHGYEASREVSVQGVVVSFTEHAATAPLGARVVVQTASGELDVHLGDGRLLQASHLTLAAGDSVRIVGENVASGEGTQFLARVIQKGNQSVALRSGRGFPLRATAKSTAARAGVL